MFRVGDFVKIKGTALYGHIVDFKHANSKLTYCIKINDKKTFIEENKLEKADKQDNNIKNKVYVHYHTENLNEDFSNEIMIRHQTLEEAMFNLDSFVKEAVYYDCKTIKIIHGKKGGILRGAVRDYLSSSPVISKFHLGNYFEGGYGVTIAYLK